MGELELIAALSVITWQIRLKSDPEFQKELELTMLDPEGVKQLRREHALEVRELYRSFLDGDVAP